MKLLSSRHLNFIHLGGLRPFNRGLEIFLVAGKCTSQMEVKHHYKSILTQCMSQEVQITGNLNIPRSIITAKPLHRIPMGQHTENQDFISLHIHLSHPDP